MKTIKLFFSIAILAFVFSSCQPETEVKTILVDFENVKLNEDSISGDSNFVSDNFTFTINDGAFWNGGIVCSAKNDTTTSGYNNQYSTIAGSGALNSSNFGVVYSPGAISCPADANGAYSIKSIMLTNSTYAYLEMKNGSLYSKKFESGDWFKVVIKGFKSKVQTSSVEVFLADFRDGKTEILKTWKKVDLSALNQVDSIAFNFDSTDKDPVWGMNTPAYVCIDNIEFTQTISTK